MCIVIPIRCYNVQISVYPISNTVDHLFPQAKNRELMKQVAALSKGKKFDRTGSSLLLP